MTTLQEIQDTKARGAIAAALEAARLSYEEIRVARDELNAMEAGGVYAEGYVEEQRRERAEKTRLRVEGHLADAHQKVEAAHTALTERLAELTAVDSDLLAAAQNTISMFMGDLREAPEQLLTAYEQSFDVREDRRAIETLAERALRVLPDTPARGLFETKWTRLRESLEDRLPQEERQQRHAITELERVREYLANVAQATTAANWGLTDPRQSGNLTAFSKAAAYEKELSAERAAIESLPYAKPTARAG